MASRGVNRVIIVGTLGRDPEVRTTTNGTVIAGMSVATSEVWKDKASGERKEQTEWHQISMFGRTAEIARDYLRKGSKVYLEGRLQTRKWQDKEGKDQYTTEIIANEFQMLDSRRDGGDQANTQTHTQSAHANPAPADFDDDIPF